MISLDQVLLLQKKVETAVEKITFLQGQIEQLKKDNDALRAKCSGLEKSLDDKSELVSTLEANQGKIEEGILTALNRLDTVENSILNGDGGSGLFSSDESVSEESAVAAAASMENEPEASPELQEVAEEIENATQDSQDVQISERSGEDDDAPAYDYSSNGNEVQASNNAVNGQFDIF